VKRIFRILAIIAVTFKRWLALPLHMTAPTADEAPRTVTDHQDAATFLLAKWA